MMVMKLFYQTENRMVSLLCFTSIFDMLSAAKVGYMLELNSQRRLLIVIAGSLAGFFTLVLAWLIFMRVVVSHFFGGSSSPFENLVILGFVPMMIAFGASIPAWALGANLWRGMLSGFVAMALFVLIDISGAQINYAPFIENETIAFVIAALTTVLIAMAGKNMLHSGVLVALLILTVTLITLRFVLPGRDLLIGPLISLSAWIFLPTLVVIFRRDK
jgi:hypothetical protein